MDDGVLKYLTTYTVNVQLHQDKPTHKNNVFVAFKCKWIICWRQIITVEVTGINHLPCKSCFTAANSLKY